jgi:hypothetical protein
MKKDEVQIGAIYRVKVSGKLCNVRVTGEHPTLFGRIGYDAVNLDTHRKIFVRSPARLRRLVRAVPLTPDEFEDLD